MITEDFCSYEVAKLLKEKGFDGLCYCHEFTDYKGNFTTYHTEYPENWNQSEPCVSIPTLQMAMKWLREIHNIIIEPESVWNGKKWEYLLFIVTPQNADFPYYEHNLYKSYEECVKAGIKYCLENLIK